MIEALYIDFVYFNQEPHVIGTVIHIVVCDAPK